MPHACGNGTCGTCKFKVNIGEVNYIDEAIPGILTEEQKAGFTLACQCKPTTSIQLIETLN